MSNPLPNSEEPKPTPEAVAEVPAAQEGPMPLLLLNTSTHLFPNLKPTTSILLQDQMETEGTLGLGESNKKSRVDTAGNVNRATSRGKSPWACRSSSKMSSSPVMVETGGAGQVRFGAFNMQGGRRRAGLAGRFPWSKPKELFPTSPSPCPCPCPGGSFSRVSTSAVPSRKAERTSKWRCCRRSPMCFTTDRLSSLRTCNQARRSAIRSSTASSSCRREDAGDCQARKVAAVMTGKGCRPVTSHVSLASSTNCSVRDSIFSLSSTAQWLMVVIQALWEAEMGGSFKPRSSIPAWATWRNPISTKNTKISQMAKARRGGSCLLSRHFGKLRQADHLRSGELKEVQGAGRWNWGRIYPINNGTPIGLFEISLSGVQDQPGQHSETPSLLKNKNINQGGGRHLKVPAAIGLHQFCQAQRWHIQSQELHYLHERQGFTTLARLVSNSRPQCESSTSSVEPQSGQRPLPGISQPAPKPRNPSETPASSKATVRQQEVGTDTSKGCTPVFRPARRRDKPFPPWGGCAPLPVCSSASSGRNFHSVAKLECSGAISVHYNLRLPVETGFHHVGQGGVYLLTSLSARLSLPKRWDYRRVSHESVNNKTLGQAWCLMPVIPALWEAEAGG
ncbi:putative uncharacterized protein C8orf44 [Plecturocebus cupreus]